MYGRSLQCLNSKIYARNAQSQPFNFQISGKSPYFQNSFFCLIEYISVSINATDAYYTSNDWKLSQLFAEPSRFELRGLHEELEALKQFSFFPPDLRHYQQISACRRFFYSTVNLPFLDPSICELHCTGKIQDRQLWAIGRNKSQELVIRHVRYCHLK